MLIWFRNERVRTVTWGGNPFKSPSSEDDPSELSPRRSFAQWHQIVKGTSDPWTVADLSAARLIGSSITDVVVQFRAVRILIAQDQLEQVLRQVRSSDQQVVVADARGLILESNAAFSEWLGIDDGVLRSLDELPNFFADPDLVGRRLKALISENKPWRGEAVVRAAKGRTTAVLVRADPVFRGPGTRPWLRSAVHRSHRSEGGRGGAKALPRWHSSQQPKSVCSGRIAKRPSGSNTHVVGDRKRSTRGARNYRCDRYFRGSRTAGKRSEVGLAHRGRSGPACSRCRGSDARRRRTMTEFVSFAHSSRSALRWRLRAATATTHERMHAHPGFEAAAAGTIELSEYRRLLVRLYGFHRPFEEIARSAAEAFKVDLDMNARARSALLVADLQTIGFAPSATATLPFWRPSLRLVSKGSLLGALYVLEGSTLGGLQIARALKNRVGNGLGMPYYSLLAGKSVRALCGENCTRTRVDSRRRTKKQ